jgi:hypothetical protein
MRHHEIRSKRFSYAILCQYNVMIVCHLKTTIIICDLQAPILTTSGISKQQKYYITLILKWTGENLKQLCYVSYTHLKATVNTLG